MWFFMTDKPEIIKELMEDEKLGRLYGQSWGSYGKLETSEETMGSISDELTCIVKDENQTITFRYNKEKLNRLKRMAREQSLEEDRDIIYTELIKKAIDELYFKEK